MMEMMELIKDEMVKRVRMVRVAAAESGTKSDPNEP